VLFPTHLAAAALLGLGRRAGRRGLALPWLLAGAALPDVLDKPLAAAGVVELYHSVGHSLLFGLVLLPVALLGPRGLAVAVGWASHLALDAVHVVVNGRAGDALFLTWPVRAPADPFGLAPIPFALQYVGTPAFFLELLIWGALGYAVLAGGSASRRPREH
jgi:hypothetical protein